MASAVTVTNITKEGSQINVGPNGVTIVTTATSSVVTLSPTQVFPTGRTWELAAGSSIPWPVGPLWAKSTTPTSILVLSGVYNFSAVPKVVITGQSVKITGIVTSAVTNKTNTILQTGDQAYQLVTETFTLSKDATFIIPTTTVPAVLSALSISVKPAVAQDVLYCTAVYGGQGAGIILATRPHEIVAPFNKGSNGYWQAIVPFYNIIGHRILLTFHQSTANKCQVNVWGLTQNPGIQLRSDGRTYPIGSHFSNINVPAKPTFRYLISAANNGVTATINGIASKLYSGVPPEGILCDIDTGITVTASSVLYDIVK